ncbi:MAG: 3-keto-disaccharide hydrolase, partial [Flavobacteriaceae bacterium]
EGDGRSIGFEFQVLDKNHADFDKGVDGNRTIGSLYDLIAAENLSEASRTDIRANGPDRWNRARIIVSEGKVQHWINHIKVVEYDRFSQSMKNLIKKSKYAKHKGFGVGSSGRILLQDHSPGDVKFKNIKIREF